MKDKLIKLFTNIRNHSEFSSMLYSKGIDVANWECPYEQSFDLMLDFVFSSEGIELINWWLYEGELEEKVIQEDDKEIDLSNVKVFVEYLLKHYKK